MTVTLLKQAEKGYINLQLNIQKKADKQFKLLAINYHHPSLKASKMSGENKFEARIDRKNRFTYLVEGQEIYILTVGPHDTGLGKK